MEIANAINLVDDLGETIDDLEESLKPILGAPLSGTASRLQLLDKAKLHTLTTYAIESALFSYIRLNGVDAKEHPIFSELTRVKDYFAKIKHAETGPIKRPMTLDKDTAARFIKHDLAADIGRERERSNRYDNNAKRKAQQETKGNAQVGTDARNGSVAKRQRTTEGPTGAKATTTPKGIEHTAAEGAVDTHQDEAMNVLSKAERKAARRQRRMQSAQAKQSPSSPQADQSAPAQSSTVVQHLPP